jgi:hypothetical protein
MGEKKCVYCDTTDVYVESNEHDWICADCLAECEPIKDGE